MRSESCTCDNSHSWRASPVYHTGFSFIKPVTEGNRRALHRQVQHSSLPAINLGSLLANNRKAPLRRHLRMQTGVHLNAPAVSVPSTERAPNLQPSLWTLSQVMVQSDSSAHTQRTGIRGRSSSKVSLISFLIPSQTQLSVAYIYPSFSSTILYALCPSINDPRPLRRQSHEDRRPWRPPRPRRRAHS